MNEALHLCPRGNDQHKAERESGNQRFGGPFGKSRAATPLTTHTTLWSCPSAQLQLGTRLTPIKAGFPPTSLSSRPCQAPCHPAPANSPGPSAA